ncbi:MAG: VOC family protein [Chloroflexi bacterium]|nr:VOC family protein [Chloroflexota bacterium]
MANPEQIDMKLELIPIPVSDIDRAKAFYVEKIGFHLDHDVQPGNGMRVIQLTPPGSACSIVMGSGMPEIDDMQPGCVKAVHLVVKDVEQARAMLISRGVAVGDIDVHPQGIKYVRFKDPDGNSWVFQEMPWRSGEF